MLPPHELHPPPEPRDFLFQPPITKAQIMRARITTAPGVELDVIQSGDPNGVPLLLLHGLSDSNASMRPMMEALPRGIRVIAVTQRGHGDSTKPAGPYTTAAFVADAVAVLDQMGVRRAVVYGHSMGSLTAQRLALAHPDRVAGLILEGGFPSLSGNAAVEAFLDAAIVHLVDPIDPAFLRDFQVSTMVRPPAPEFVEMVVREAAKLPAHAWKQILEGMMTEDLSRELAAIRTPTLLMWGDGDTFVGRSDQDRLLSIPGARLAVFEGIGHAPHWEDPARAAELVSAFVARHVAQTVA